MNAMFLGFSGLLVLLSCTPSANHPKVNTDKAEKIEAPHANSLVVKKIDLSSIALSEKFGKIEDSDGSILKSNGKKYETMSGLTAIGYNATKIFSFGSLILSSSDHPTEVIFHLEDGTSILKFIEVKITDENLEQAFLDELDKRFGKPNFAQNAKKENGMGVDEKGNAISSDNIPEQKFMVWEKNGDRKNYYVSQNRAEGQKVLELTILDPNEKFGKQYMSVRSLDWYK